MLIIDRRHRYYNYIFLLLFCFCLLFLFNSNCSKIDSSFQSSLHKPFTFDCTDNPLKEWCENQLHLCNSSSIIFDKLFAKTNSIILQTTFAKGKREGGEELANVLNQDENDEYFHFEKGFIQFPCQISLSKEIFRKTHLSNIFSSLTSYRTYQNLYQINEITIAVNRYDYVNFYHTITDLYTVYIICRFFDYNPKLIHILFLDAHPKGNLDLLWSQLFHSYTRLGQLNISSIYYKELIWSPPQSKSELDVRRFRTVTPSYFPEFRDHFLQEFDIHSETNKSINCQNINIFFLLRHNYIAHPRNPTGQIERQLLDEDQILNELKIKFENYSTIHFNFNHFEQLSIQEQLTIITQTDLFLGMHGAGLTHVIFMKSNRILIELSTARWQRQKHFEQLSSINNINYHRCLIENGHSTTAEVIFNCITEKLFPICPFYS